MTSTDKEADEVGFRHAFVSRQTKARTRTRPRRRADRIGSVFAAVHESAFGTKRTFRGLVPMSAFGGKADIVRKSQNVRLRPGPRAQCMGEAVGAALLALATLRLWGLHEYVHEVGLQPSHLTRHPVLTGSELQDDLLQSGQTTG